MKVQVRIILVRMNVTIWLIKESEKLKLFLSYDIPQHKFAFYITASWIHVAYRYRQTAVSGKTSLMRRFTWKNMEII